MVTGRIHPDSVTPADMTAASAVDLPDTLPRTAALRWFGAAYLLVLGMSFLILPRGPISPMYGLIWLRGPFFILSGLTLLWLCSLRLSRRATDHGSRARRRSLPSPWPCNTSTCRPTRLP